MIPVRLESVWIEKGRKVSMCEATKHNLEFTRYLFIICLVLALYLFDSNSNDIFKIDFADVYIPYKHSIRLGEEFFLTTDNTSLAKNNGFGTSAEVIFESGTPPYRYTRNIVRYLNRRFAFYL